MPAVDLSPRPVRTTIQIELSGNRVCVRAPNNKELCVRMLKLALQAIQDGQPAQVDSGPGGSRILVPASANLTDLYHHGQKKL